MTGINYLVLVVIIALMLHHCKIVARSESSDIIGGENIDSLVPREVMEELTMLSEVDEMTEKDAKRALRKRGWLRRALRRGWRWVKRNPVKTAQIVGALIGGKK